MIERLRMGTRVKTKDNSYVSVGDWGDVEALPAGLEGVVDDSKGIDEVAYLIKFDCGSTFWISEYGIEPVQP